MSFEELIKKYESSMAVPMYSKALVIDFMKKAYEAGLYADVHTDNSAVIAELEAQIEKMKCCPTCDNNKEEHTPEEHYRCKTCKKFCNWALAD